MPDAPITLATNGRNGIRHPIAGNPERSAPDTSDGRTRRNRFRTGRGGRLRIVPKPPLDPLDFLDVDALLTDEERDVRDTVRRFVGDRVLPGIADWFEEGVFPKEVAAE